MLGSATVCTAGGLVRFHGPTTEHLRVTVLLHTMPPFIWAERGEPATSIVRVEEEAELGGKTAKLWGEEEPGPGP
jgi:hypothetical protein